MGTLKRAFANNIRADGKPRALEVSTVTAHASDYINWQAVTTASTLTAVAGRGYPINTTSKKIV